MAVIIRKTKIAQYPHVAVRLKDASKFSSNGKTVDVESGEHNGTNFLLFNFTNLRQL